MRPRTIARLGLLALALALALGLHTTALAQPEVVAVEPAVGARLASPPERVRVAFSAPVAAPSSLRLLTVYGQVVAQAAGPAPANPAALEVALSGLPPGVYTAVWSAGEGGAARRGNFAFTVLSAGAADGPAEQAAIELGAELLVNHPPPSPLSVGLRGAMLLGAAGALGGWAFFVALLMPALAARGLAPAPSVVRRWRLGTASLLLLAVGAAAAMLVAHTIEIAGRLDLRLLPEVARASLYGLMLSARIASGLALLVLLAPWSAEPPPAGWRGVGELLPLGGLLLITFSLAGHASAEAAPLLPVAADWLHLSAAALWLGGLAMLAALLPGQLRALPNAARAPVLGRLLTRFSAVSLLCAVALAATGAYAARRQISALPELWQSGYGQALLVKLVIFAALSALGAYHLLRARGGTASWAAWLADSAMAWRPPHALLRAEALMAAVAVLAAGALTSLTPPAVFAQAAGRGVDVSQLGVGAVPTYRGLDTARTVDGLQIRIGVDPTLPGSSTLSVAVTDGEGKLASGVELVQLAFALPDLDIGSTQIDAVLQPDAIYRVSGPPLSVLGDWQMQVLVRRPGVADVRATFTVPVVSQSLPLFLCSFTSF